MKPLTTIPTRLHSPNCRPIIILFLPNPHPILIQLSSNSHPFSSNSYPILIQFLPNSHPIIFHFSSNYHHSSQILTQLSFHFLSISYSILPQFFYSHPNSYSYLILPKFPPISHSILIPFLPHSFLTPSLSSILRQFPPDSYVFVNSHPILSRSSQWPAKFSYWVDGGQGRFGELDVPQQTFYVSLSLPRSFLQISLNFPAKNIKFQCYAGSRDRHYVFSNKTKAIKNKVGIRAPPFEIVQISHKRKCHF